MNPLISASILLAASSLAAQTISFSASAVSAGTAPVSVRLFDFNGDKKPDIAVINAGGSNTVSVLLNLGGGTFAAPVKTPTGGLGSAALTSGDFNHDGKADLAVINTFTNNVSVLLGNGDGSFRLSSFAGVGEGPVALTEADFNHDGNLDLAVVNSVTGNVSILLGNANGTFSGAPSIFVGSAPTGVRAGDFNGDGIPDLAVTNGTQGEQVVQIFLGNGDGTFRTGSSLNAGIEPFTLVVRDFNRDGKLDLAVSNLASNTISIMLGNGDGTFKPAVNYPAGNGPVAVRPGAFSQQRVVDLAACADVSGAILVFAGKGDGTFQPPQSFSVGAPCNSLAVADLNQDGKPDIVTATTSGLVVLINNGSN